MSSFTALMALSASKTQEQNNIVQMAIQERQRKEQLQRKQQAEQDAKNREMEVKMRLKHFEDEKREQERRKRSEEVAKAREAALQRKKDEQRDALLYGPKKASSAAARSSSSASSSGGGAGLKERRRAPLDDDDDDDSPSGSVLTRQELRERKLQAEMKRLYTSGRRSGTAHSYTKPGRRLPGGAVDIQTTQQSPDALSGKSVRDRLASMPNTLTKLNTVKRDTRTIDEIRTDLQKKKEGKVLDGDEAKSFDDWFSPSKKKDLVKKIQSGSANNSGANTPTYNAYTTTPSSSSSAGAKRSNVPASTSAKPVKSSALKAPIPKSSSYPVSARSANSSRAGSLDKILAPKGSASQASRSSKLSSTADRDRDRYASSRPSTSSSMHSKKRRRSESRSESPPPRRAAPSIGQDDLPGDISSAIWSMFGRKRDKYMGMDVYSDDEDMEADADALEREEVFSSRVARREDLEAFEEERRHEEEKRRRKKEKERLSRQ